MGGEVILWKTFEEETLTGETSHCTMATLLGETSIGGDFHKGRCHGVRGQRVRHHGRRQTTDQLWCLGGDINQGKSHGWWSCDVRHCGRRQYTELQQHCRVGGRRGWQWQHWAIAMSWGRHWWGEMSWEEKLWCETLWKETTSRAMATL